MHFGRIKSAENASSGCKCRFIAVNRRVLNHISIFQQLKKHGYLSLGKHIPCLRHWPVPLSPKF